MSLRGQKKVINLDAKSLWVYGERLIGEYRSRDRVVIYEVFFLDMARGHMNVIPNKNRIHTWMFARLACWLLHHPKCTWSSERGSKLTDFNGMSNGRGLFHASRIAFIFALLWLLRKRCLSLICTRSDRIRIISKQINLAHWWYPMYNYSRSDWQRRANLHSPGQQNWSLINRGSQVSYSGHCREWSYPSERGYSQCILSLADTGFDTVKNLKGNHLIESIERRQYLWALRESKLRGSGYEFYSR